VVRHLRDLGVTTVELMPVHAFVQDRHLLEKGLSNYWGYNTIGFFAPQNTYAIPPPARPRSSRRWWRGCTMPGIEVILDVVYNHTAEGNQLGPTLSFKGIDNASYYRLMPDDKRYYINDTGTGNTLNLSQPRVLQMVMDSLRYWVTEMHVDGFRFDLATILGREPLRLRRGRRLPRQLRRTRCWRGQADRRALGPRPRRLPGGRLPARLGGVERPLPRHRARLLEGRRGPGGRVASRITASGDLFNHSGRRPWASVNFVTAHDGFTLNDLVSYNDRSTTRPTARTTRTAIPTTCPGTAAWRARPTIPEVRTCAARQQRNLLATCCCPRACRCSWAATSSAAPRRATTTPIARTTRSAG
jgi:isoamylase